MKERARYILVCAGEDSGDSIGESLVKAIAAKGCLGVVGAGGARMRAAGLCPIVDYETLPVSGFGDVVPRYFKLRQSFNQLKTALESPNCVGLIAIDYPGFNMKLVKLAGMLHKPALYVAPPQVWAWKRKRAKELAKNPFVKLAVFFDFEERVYADAGCNVVRVKHPFVNSEFAIQNSEIAAISSQSLLLLPGSRKSQALRNLPVYLKAVANLTKKPESITIACARRELVTPIQNFVADYCKTHHLKSLSNTQVVEVPPEISTRKNFFGSYSFAISCPGTATLELALSKVPFVVCTKPDFLTYCLGRLFIKTKYFALPNIILEKQVYPEYILGPFQQCHSRRLSSLDGDDRESPALAKKIDDCVNGKGDARLRGHDIYTKLSNGQSLEQLALEFLGQFV